MKKSFQLTTDNVEEFIDEQKNRDDNSMSNNVDNNILSYNYQLQDLTSLSAVSSESVL